jgi:hypothetical protein
VDKKIEEIKDQILQIIHPKAILLFGKKITHPENEIKSIDLCIITDTDDKKETMRKIFINVDSKIPFNAYIYTCKEWAQLSSEDDSFAYRIKSRGTLLYGEQI